MPERPDREGAVLAQIEAQLAPTRIIGSSTSGIKPTVMQAGMSHPERLVVAHPYNPVYLLPVVEIVGGSTLLAPRSERRRGCTTRSA